MGLGNWGSMNFKVSSPTMFWVNRFGENVKVAVKSVKIHKDLHPLRTSVLYFSRGRLKQKVLNKNFSSVESRPFSHSTLPFVSPSNQISHHPISGRKNTPPFSRAFRSTHKSHIFSTPGFSLFRYGETLQRKNSRFFSLFQKKIFSPKNLVAELDFCLRALCVCNNLPNVHWMFRLKMGPIAVLFEAQAELAVLAVRALVAETSRFYSSTYQFPDYRE